MSLAGRTSRSVNCWITPSGLYNYTRDLTPAGILRDRHKQWAPQDIVARAIRRAPDFPPGTGWAYNNTAFVLLGMVLEKCTRRAYGEQVGRGILRPLRLRHTLVRDDTEHLPEPHAHGYIAVDGQLVDITEYNPSTAGAAGSMVSTAADLNSFFAALLTGALLRPHQLLEMKTTTATGTPGVGSGLGMTRHTLPNGVSVWGKDGGFHSYRTWSFHTSDARRQLTVSITAAFNEPPTTDEFLARVAGLFG